jgi:methyl-accepting chemotaxis protein
MTDEELQPINPNTADEEALVQLAGVGPKLAAKIVAGRPYSQAEDLLSVPGLGEKLLASINPYLVFDEPADSQVVAEVESDGEGTVPADEDERAKPSDVVDETVNYLVHLPSVIREELKKKQGFNRRTTILLMAGTAIASIILSMILTLMVMTVINGSLSVRRNAQVQSLASAVSQMDVELDDLDSRLEALSRRLQTVEGLSGRITTVEEAFDVVQTDIEQAVSQVEAMQTNVDDLANQVENLAGNIGKFDQFLSRLFELLNQLQGVSQPD